MAIASFCFLCLWALLPSSNFDARNKYRASH